MSVLDAFLSGLLVWRFLRGGHWERWYVDSPVNSLVWHRVDRCSRVSTYRPSGLCRGRPTCVTYRPRVRQMGHTPVGLAPWVLTLDQQAAPLEREVARRGSRRWRLGIGRRSAYSACARLIVLREHDLYGWHDVTHVGACGRGAGECGVKPPPKPIKAAEPTYRLAAPREPGKATTL